ncbi:MAG: hypothetical protein ACRD3W_04645 [Terriglobales bacterium]
MINKGKLSLICMLLSATISGAPSFAHSVDTTHHLIVVPADCPQLSDSQTRWVNVHGHHALSLHSDGQDWTGFEVMAFSTSIAHHQVPGIIRGPVPAGKLTFRVLSSTIENPTFLVELWSKDGTCFFSRDKENPVNGLVTAPLSGSSGEVQIYLNDEVVDTVTITDIRLNGIPLESATFKDTGDKFPGLSFCTSNGIPCE